METQTNEEWANREVDSMGTWINPDNRTCFLGAMIEALRSGMSRGLVRGIFQNAFIAAARDGFLRGPEWMRSQGFTNV